MIHKFTFGLLALAFLAGAMEAQATCTAGNPNNAMVEATPTYNAATAPNGLEGHADGTVTHHLTGLIWSRCSVGQYWDGATCVGDASTMPWAKALTASVTANTNHYLGYSDWRLPNRRELLSIRETCGYQPAINQEVFPATPDIVRYWSSTTFQQSANTAWTNSQEEPKSDWLAARLVRGGRMGADFDRLAPQVKDENLLEVTVIPGYIPFASFEFNRAGLAYWVVVPQGSAAPTAAEVKAGGSYRGVEIAASGTEGAALTFTIGLGGLAGATNYDFYVVGYDANNDALAYTPSHASFTTSDAPDPFTFTDQFGVARDTLITSDTITVSGITASMNIYIFGGEYRVNGGVWTTADGTVNNGDTVQVRHTSAAVFGGTTITMLAVGGGGDVFYSVTENDTDGDGTGDLTDPDDDGDGVPDVDDALPFDPTESVDTDGDGIGNNVDTDDDGDGVDDRIDAFPLDPAESVDTDDDGIGNNADTDDDGDGVDDVDDAFPLDPTRSETATTTSGGGGGGAFGLWGLLALFGFVYRLWWRE